MPDVMSVAGMCEFLSAAVHREADARGMRSQVVTVQGAGDMSVTLTDGNDVVTYRWTVLTRDEEIEALIAQQKGDGGA